MEKCIRWTIFAVAVFILVATATVFQKGPIRLRDIRRNFYQRLATGRTHSNISSKDYLRIFTEYSTTNTTVLLQEVKNNTVFSDRKNVSLFIDQDVNDTSSNTDKSSKSRLQVAILTPSTTRSVKTVSLKTFSLTSLCIPSIKATVEQMYDYIVYVGTEKDDKLVGYADTIQAMSSANTQIRLQIVPGGTLVKVANEIASIAFAEGADYIIRINDDTKFVTANWTSFGISTLKGYKPPNVGVVGPTCNQGNTHIMTHDMVHRTHLKIFKNYYPPEFENWWLDDWITLVYMPDRSTKLKTWEVVHTLQQGTRYRVNSGTKKRLDLMESDKIKIQTFIKNIK